jgi:uncharacterized protein YxeA
MKRILIIIVIILALAGGATAAWHYWHKNKNFSDNSSPQNNYGYLVIKEWGVRFKLNDKTKNAYVYEKTTLGGYSDAYYLSSKEIDGYITSHPSCKGLIKATHYERAKPDTPPQNFTEEFLKLRGPKIGEYYYWTNAGPRCDEQASAIVLKTLPKVEDLEGMP